MFVNFPLNQSINQMKRLEWLEVGGFNCGWLRPDHLRCLSRLATLRTLQITAIIDREAVRNAVRIRGLEVYVDYRGEKPR
jgi:hypothetical protein